MQVSNSMDCILTYKVDDKTFIKYVSFNEFSMNPPLSDIYSCDGYFSLYAAPNASGVFRFKWSPTEYLDYSDSIATDGYVKKDQKFNVVVENIRTGCVAKDSLIVKVVSLAKPEIYPVSSDGLTLATTKLYPYYQWLLDGVEIQGATNGLLVAKQNGNYRVEVRNDYECKEKSNAYTIESVSIDNPLPISSQDLVIYPNPTTDIINIHYPTSVNAAITSIEGKLIKYHSGVRAIPVNGLPKGIYLIHITDSIGNMLKVERFVKL